MQIGSKKSKRWTRSTPTLTATLLLQTRQQAITLCSTIEIPPFSTRELCTVMSTDAPASTTYLIPQESLVRGKSMELCSTPEVGYCRNGSYPHVPFISVTPRSSGSAAKGFLARRILTEFLVQQATRWLCSNTICQDRPAHSIANTQHIPLGHVSLSPTPNLKYPVQVTSWLRSPPLGKL